MRVLDCSSKSSRAAGAHQFQLHSAACVVAGAAKLRAPELAWEQAHTPGRVRSLLERCLMKRAVLQALCGR